MEDINRAGENADPVEILREIFSENVTFNPCYCAVEW